MGKPRLSPPDPVEWMPFIQAALITGDANVFEELAVKVKKSESLTQQACSVVQNLKGIEIEMEKLAKGTFCVPSN